MTYSELIVKYDSVLKMLFQKRISDVFNILGELSHYCRNNDLSVQLETHRTTYQNILKYSFELTDDPQKEQVYNRLLKAIIELADDMKEDIIFNNHLLTTYARKPEIEKTLAHLEDESEHLSDTLSFEREIKDILKQQGLKTDNTTHTGSLDNIFSVLFLTDSLKGSDIKLLETICESPALMWYDKSLVVSALTLSLIRHFDENKAEMLLKFYQHNDEQVKQRALAGLVFCLLYHDKRLSLYPSLMHCLAILQDDSMSQKMITAILIQFIRAQDTERLHKRLNEEIIPEVMKFRSKLEEKLDLNNILPNKKFDEKNPDWESFFDGDDKMLNKFEEITKLQLEGADIFHGTFAMLKQFSFFKEMSNWFLPFYKEQETIQPIADQIVPSFDTREFIENLEAAPVLCNSDKYSFCLNLEQVIASQNPQMLQMMSAEIGTMREMKKDDEMVNAMTKHNTIFAQYIQDLYRFFKLYPLKHEFPDIFTMNLQLSQSNTFRTLVNDNIILRNISEFYFEKGYYSEAAEIFEYLIAHDKTTELFEKAAYCYQKKRDYRTALNLYHKAELAGTPSVWLLKKMAFCSNMLHEHKAAADHYLDAEKLEPENLDIQTSLGHTYMSMDDHDAALKYYFKVEYLAPDNRKIQRPIAWCSFVLGKLETAHKYFSKLIGPDACEHDYINLGHVEWCMGNKQEAIRNYRLALAMKQDNMEWFNSTFETDKKHLIANGISAFDINLMMDYVKMK